MVINEKALLQRMKEAYKNQGYTVAVEDGRMWINGGFWLIWMDADEVSNEVLSLITLHTRKTLQEHEAYKVVKGDDGPIVQKLLINVAMEVAQTMGRQLELRGEHDVEQMLKTDLRYDGCGVWQSNETLCVMLIDPRYEAMIQQKKDVTLLGNGLYIEGEISGAWVMKVDKKNDAGKLAHLAGIRWTMA